MVLVPHRDTADTNLTRPGPADDIVHAPGESDEAGARTLAMPSSALRLGFDSQPWLSLRGATLRTGESALWSVVRVQARCRRYCVHGIMLRISCFNVMVSCRRFHDRPDPDPRRGDPTWMGVCEATTGRHRSPARKVQAVGGGAGAFGGQTYASPRRQVDAILGPARSTSNLSASHHAGLCVLGNR